MHTTGGTGTTIGHSVERHCVQLFQLRKLGSSSIAAHSIHGIYHQYLLCPHIFNSEVS